MDRKYCGVFIFFILLIAIILTGCGGGGANPLQPMTKIQPSESPATSTAPAAAAPAPAPAATPASAPPAPAAPPAETPSPLPAVPASAKVYTKIQDTTDNWNSCSDCAGGAVTSNYWTAPFQSSPSMSGSSREFFIGGPAWADVLWYKTLPADNSATHFLWDFYVYFDPASAAGVWSAEYDLWQSIGGKEFMIGSQCNFGDGVWDTWDSKNNHWVHTSIPCPRFTPSTWHHIQWYVERISPTEYRYNTLVVDGQPHTLNQVFEANPINWVDAIGVQWQLDQNGAGTPLHEWIDNVTLSIW